MSLNVALIVTAIATVVTSGLMVWVGMFIKPDPLPKQTEEDTSAILSERNFDNTLNNG